MAIYLNGCNGDWTLVGNGIMETSHPLGMQISLGLEVIFHG